VRTDGNPFLVQRGFTFLRLHRLSADNPAWPDFKPREEYAISELPAVTLIIAAYNEEAVLEKKLQNTAELNYPPESCR
jgi:cellulose synthase/poly-beta-1,6-N-acetylglucosamine synthase-like glycosyltransferase